MSTREEICTMALGFLGQDEEIENFETEKGVAARACRRHYDSVIEEVLRDFAWLFARKTVTLQLVEEEPTDEWGFAYRLPVDCVKALRIPSGFRNETRQEVIPFERRDDVDDAGGLIYTDQAEAQLEYTRRASTPAFYPSDFVRAAAYLLSTAIGPTVVSGDPYNLIEKNLQLYGMAIAKARKNATDEQERDEENEAQTIRER